MEIFTWKAENGRNNIQPLELDVNIGTIRFRHMQNPHMFKPLAMNFLRWHL